MTPTESPESKDAAKRSLLSRFRQLNIWNKLGVIGSIASAVSVPMAIYFYVATIQTRDLMYHTFGDTWTVYRPGSSSKLTLAYSGKPLEHSVFIKQIAIWNEGHQSIRPEHILERVVLVANSSVKVLDATVVDVTRELTHFKIDTNDLDSGRIPISWDILEHKDGALVQIMCAVEESSMPLSVTVEGVIEGQKSVRTTRRTQLGDSLFMESAALVISLLMLLGGCQALILGFSKYGRPHRTRLFVCAIFILSLGSFYGWVAFAAVFDWPPFQMRQMMPKKSDEFFMGDREVQLRQMPLMTAR